MAANLRTSLNNGLNTGLRQSITGGVNELDFFKTASLDLQFASKKTLNDRVSSSNLITFTRASSGTYVDGDGLIATAAVNTPRFDHDPATGESLGLLIEESRTNLAKNSEDLSTASWTATSSAGYNPPATTPNSDTAPDGAATATLVSCDPIPSGKYAVLYQYGTVGTGTYTGSIWLKAATAADVGKTIQIEIYAFNVTPRVIATHVLTSDWVRVSTAQNIPSGVTSAALQFGQVGSGPNVPATSFLAWGAQLEAGSLTSYIPTEASTVTRAADVAEITGANFSSFYNQSEGTVFSDFETLLGNTTLNQVVSINNGSNLNRINIANRANGTYQTEIVANGIHQQRADYPYASGRKVTLAYKTNDVNYSYDGILGTQDTNATLPAVNQMDIGFLNDYLNGHIKRLAYFPTRLPDATLQNITS